MKGKDFGSVGSRIAKAAQHGISSMMNFFKKKGEENHVEQPAELPVEPPPVIEEKVENVEAPQQAEQVTIKKVKRLVEHDMCKTNELKVVGKIDLDALNQRTRPIKKSKRQLEKDRKKRLAKNEATNDTNLH